MKNGTFSIRYLCQEILKIAIVFIIIKITESIIGSDAIIAEAFLVLGIFFLTHKVISIIKYAENDEDTDLKKVGFTWRTKRKLGVKLSKEAIKLNCRNEDNFGLILIIFLLIIGFKTNSLRAILILILSSQVIYPDHFGFLDKAFDNYYRFRGKCAGIIRINGGKYPSKEIYFVSIVDYDAKQELVVKVEREKMKYFKNGEIIEVVYGKTGKNAVSIY